MVYSCTRNCPSICMHTRMLIGQEIPVIDHSPVLTLFFLVTILCLAWSSKKQKSIVRSSIEAKYRAMVSIASKVLWVKCFFFFFFFFFSELDVSISSSSLIYYDDMGAIYLCTNPVFRNAIDFHFVRNKVQSCELRVSCVNRGSTCRCSNKQSPYLLHEFKPLSSIRVQALYSRRV